MRGWLAVIVCVGFLVGASVASAQNKVWSKRYEYLGNDDRATSLAIDQAGNAFVVGSTNNTANQTDILIVKYDANGQRLWVRAFGKAGTHEIPVDSEVDPQGNLVVTGYLQASSDAFFDYVVLKYNTNGQLLWIRRFGDAAGFEDRASSLAVDSLGNILVTGRSYGANLKANFATVKYDPNGNRMWVRRYDGQGLGDIAQRVAVDSANNVIVTGESEVTDEDVKVVTIKYNADGAPQWTRLYDRAPASHDRPRDLEVDSNGNVLVMAWFVGGGVEGTMLVKYLPDGTLTWQQRIGRLEDRNRGMDIALDAQDNIAIGYWRADPVNGQMDYGVGKYGPNSALLWQRRYNGPLGGDDFLTSIAVDGDGAVYVTGSSAGSADNLNGMDFATVKYSSAGVPEWARRYNGSSDLFDGGVDVAVAPDGHVVVAGTSVLASIDLPPDPDLFTIKYNTGNTSSP